MGLFGKSKGIEIIAPHEGTVRTLKSLEDGVFSEGMMGDGLVIKAKEELKTLEVYAPMDGVLETVFPTGHAYGIKSGNFEILVHIGVDTVNLNGKGFKSHVKQGNAVKAGDLLATVEVEEVREHAPTADTIILNTSKNKMTNKIEGHVVKGGEIFKLS